MILMKEEDLMDQAGMERAFRNYFRDVKQQCPGTLNDMLDAEFLCCDRENMTVTLRTRTKPWMANPGGITHGGITAAYMDLIMGLLCRYFSGGRMTVSIHVDVNYLRAVPIGREIRIGAKITKAGNSICFAEGRMWMPEEPTVPLVTAGGSYSVAKK